MMDGGRRAIVVEGGGMRSIFAAGVLDAFAEAGFAPFDLAIGTSAGAAVLASYLSRQGGRNRRCITTFMRRREFVHPWRGPARALRGRHWMDLDWLFDTFAREDPLDVPALLASGIEFVIAATDAEDGGPVYFGADGEDPSELIKASSALPVLYRGPVAVRGRRVVDGGVAAPIPVQEAWRRGADRILVVRTRQSGVVKPAGLEYGIGAWVFRRSPALARAIRRTPETYRAAVDFIARPPEGCTMIEVAPPRPLATGRTTQRLDALEGDYAMGRDCGIEAMARWSRLEAERGVGMARG